MSTFIAFSARCKVTEHVLKSVTLHCLRSEKVRAEKDILELTHKTSIKLIILLQNPSLLKKKGLKDCNTPSWQASKKGNF